MPEKRVDPLQPLRVVHLSDLHFGAHFDALLWGHISRTVLDLRPSAILVTGDLVNSPWPRMLVRAKRQLDALAERAGAELVVIPGNHDVALSGFVPLPYLHSLYDFLVRQDAAKGVRLPTADGIPNDSGRWWLRLFRAMRDDVRLLIWLLWQLPRKWSMRGAGPEILRRNRLLLVGFDSNHALRQSSGRIRPGEIYALAESVRLPEDADLPAGGTAVAPFALRLGILHHHPLPIPYSDVTDSLTNFEPFLVLRDAGTLLRELAKNHFDLVLHGHKHFYSYTRISYPSGPRGSHPMGVLAAGSGTVRHKESGRNSFNVLDISRNGRTRVTTFFTGGNASLDPTRPDLDFHLHDFEELKRRNYWRSIERQGVECDRIIKEVEIDEFGAGQHLVQIEGLRTLQGHGAPEVVHTPWVGTGRILPDTIRIRHAVTTPGVDIDLPEYEYDASGELRRIRPASEESGGGGGTSAPSKPGDDQSVRVEVRFNRAVPQSPDSLGYGVEYRTHNAFATSRWEAINLHRAAREWTAVAVRVPCRKLWFRVRLGAGIFARNPFVRCDFPPDYPSLKLDPSGYLTDTPKTKPDDPGSKELKQKPSSVHDGDFTANERAYLRAEGPNAWVLEVPYPLVGYRYMILWDLPENVREDDNSEVRGQTEMYRTWLLKVRQAWKNDRRDRRQVEATAVLDELMRAILARYHAADPEERFSLSLMVFDKVARRLVVTDGVRTWDGALRLDFSLGVGEGLAGAVFKQRRPLLYHVASLKAQAGGNAYLASDDGKPEGATDYQTLLAIPIVHPALLNVPRPSPLDVIAIMSIGSDSPGSGLVRLASEKDPEARRAMDQLRALVQATFVRYVRILRGA
ncbi:MAG TPA: metallophosphoesterase [Candidatus Polarisedimenticolia bacterium]|nr:metallophosphoesterase [Candidatus Polarisedimenticolia bacterium]